MCIQYCQNASTLTLQHVCPLLTYFIMIHMSFFSGREGGGTQTCTDVVSVAFLLPSSCACPVKIIKIINMADGCIIGFHFSDINFHTTYMHSRGQFGQFIISTQFHKTCTEYFLSLCVVQDLLYGVCSVSYTHLDVYKRQLTHCSDELHLFQRK